MAYMRGEWYVWEGGDGEDEANDYLEIRNGADVVRMPMDRFEELVAMGWHGMTDEVKAHAMNRAYDKYWGNFGCIGLAKAIAHPSAIDVLRGALEDKG